MLTSGNRLGMDFSVFHVGQGQSGWAPHRDRGGDSTGAFRSDGTPQYVTTWVALSDATCTNSCLHVVPKKHDPGYLGGDPEGVPPIHGVLLHGGEAALQHVRALPCRAGSVIQFSHRLLHWGSAAADGPSATVWRTTPEPPRIALSFASIDDRFEKPFLSRDALPMPPVEQRAALVAALALLYTQHDPPSAARRALYWDCVQAASTAFDPAFYAMLERNHEADDAGGASQAEGRTAGGYPAAPAMPAMVPAFAAPAAPPAALPAPAPMAGPVQTADASDGSYPMFTGEKLERKLAQLAKLHAEGGLTAAQYAKAQNDVRVAKLIDPAFAPLRPAEVA